MGLRIPCLRCGKFEPECRCEPLPPEPEEPEPQVPAVAPVRTETIRMRREKRSGGREVVLLEGFPVDEDLEALSRDLKKSLGAGGSAKGGIVEVQGDHRDRIATFLAGRGYRPVRAGG
ncbi:MAG: translation initiation factor [Planctomycetota bacterium]|nr:MAG: translation initiation factor [Planctomycetota bacterium]